MRTTYPDASVGVVDFIEIKKAAQTLTGKTDKILAA